MKIRKAKRYFLILIVIAILIIILNNYKKQKNLEETIVESEIVVKGQTISNLELEQNITIEPHVDKTTGAKYVTYEDFGAKAQEGYDDFNVIKETHDFANENNYEVRAEEGKTYHIYRWESTNAIKIQTNTNWNNANIVIHDEDINDKNTRNYAIFQISSNMNSTTINDKEFLNDITINKETKKIEKLSGYGNCLCIVYNSDKKHYIRSGNNENSGASQEDLFKIDNNGNVLNEIQWDFEKITSIRLIPIPEETIKVENANFTTILPENDYEQSGGYFNRSILCNRSNVIISNVNHNVNDTERIAGPYFGFFRISYATDVLLQNLDAYAHKYNNKSNYDLILEHSTNITIDNVTSNDIEDIYRWGITGSNYTKDITYRNCVLNRIDAHCGVHNLTVENCTVGVKGLTLIGSGELNLKNVTRLGDGSFITLRSDYGSTWNGTINIENCVYKPTNSNQIISFTTTYNENNELHNYGYDLYLPNINITNLKIEDENSTNNSNEYYIFYNPKDRTGTENGDMTNAYNLPENVTINNYETTSGKKIKLFYNKFYNDLNEIGINLSMPLEDKKEVEIIGENNEEVKDQTVTNKSITIKVPKTEGIETSVKINNEEIDQEELTIEQEGNYKIETTYKNSAGEQEQSNVNAIIDKTNPVILGVSEAQTYKHSITPNILENNLAEIKLLCNGQVVENYQQGQEITAEGIYQLSVIDKAGNMTTVNFQILEPTDEDYKIEEGIIKNINNNTTLSEFKEKLQIQINEKFEITREETKLEENEIIATGDILTTESGKKYTLIVTGDINKDGDVDIKDIVKLRKYLLYKNGILDEIEMISADTNLDGKEITIKDLVRMRIIVLSKEVL